MTKSVNPAEKMHNAYKYFENEKDKVMLDWVRKFNPYDLYSKAHAKPDIQKLKPYYDDLFAEFLPNQLDW
jgi:inositol oxygenase